MVSIESLRGCRAGTCVRRTQLHVHCLEEIPLGQLKAPISDKVRMLLFERMLHEESGSQLLGCSISFEAFEANSANVYTDFRASVFQTAPYSPQDSPMSFQAAPQSLQGAPKSP